MNSLLLPNLSLNEHLIFWKEFKKEFEELAEYDILECSFLGSKLICTFPCPSSVMDINFGCSIGLGAKSCLKFHSLDCVKHSQGIGFSIITVEFFSFACQINILIFWG